VSTETQRASLVADAVNTNEMDVVAATRPLALKTTCVRPLGLVVTATVPLADQVSSAGLVVGAVGSNICQPDAQLVLRGLSVTLVFCLTASERAFTRARFRLVAIALILCEAMNPAMAGAAKAARMARTDTETISSIKVNPRRDVTGATLEGLDINVLIRIITIFPMGS